MVSSEKFPAIDFEIAHFTFIRVVMFGFSSFLILLALVKYELINKIKIHSVSLSLGEASYSLYLIHLPILGVLLRFLIRLNVQNVFLLHLLVVAIIVMVCYTSILFCKWVEKPLMNRLNALGKKM